VEENRRRGRSEPEYELLDTGIFAEDRYFDVLVEYAKAAPDDLVIRISITNRGTDAAPLHLLPALWCRNTWAWGRHEARPVLKAVPDEQGLVHVEHPALGTYWLACEGAPPLLFTENETNTERLWGVPNGGRVKDGINDAIVEGKTAAVARDGAGTKVARTTSG